MVLSSVQAYSLFGGLTSLFFLISRIRSPLRHIPTVGPWYSFLPAIGRVAGFIQLPKLVEQGYAKYKPGGLFKIVDFRGGWTVVVTGATYVEEVRRAPDNALSLDAASSQVLQTSYTMGQPIVDNPYHVPIIRGKLTRTIPLLLPELYDEVASAFTDTVGSPEKWTSIKGWDTVSYITSRVTNRMLVGTPLCREPSYCNLMTGFTMAVIKDSTIISSCPSFLRPIVARIVGRVSRCKKETREFLRPLYEERTQKIAEYNSTDYPGKPNNFLAWLLDEASGEAATLDGVASRLLAMNFASIHTTSTVFTHCLYDLAAHSEYIQPLREEIAPLIEELGWTKTAFDKMIILDSFFKESARINGISHLSLTREALKPFAFSDGTVIPAGTTIASPTMTDEDIYGPTVHTFDAFRFSSKRTSGDDEGNTSHNATTPNANFLLWGYGKHACPGRFFAATEIKMLLAYVVMTYEVRLEVEGQRPRNLGFGPAAQPDATAAVMFRRYSGK